MYDNFGHDAEQMGDMGGMGGFPGGMGGMGGMNGEYHVYLQRTITSRYLRDCSHHAYTQIYMLLVMLLIDDKRSQVWTPRSF